MEDINNDKLEKLKQEQLIASILNRQNVEHNALVEAAKKSMNNSQVDIKQEQNKLVKEELKKKEIEDKEKLEFLRKKIIDKEIDEMLEKIRQEEELAAQKRREETDRILKELKEENRRKKSINLSQIARMEANKFRQKYNIKYNKIINFKKQYELYTRNEKKKNREPNKELNDKTKATNNKEKNVNVKVENINNKNKNETRSKDFRKIYEVRETKNKVNNKEKLDSAIKEIPLELVNKPKTQKLNVKKITKYRITQAIQRYTSVMEFYEMNKLLLQRNRKEQTIENTTRRGFIEQLKYAVNHKLALNNVEEKGKEKPNFRARIID